MLKGDNMGFPVSTQKLLQNFGGPAKKSSKNPKGWLFFGLARPTLKIPPKKRVSVK
jgi:hypothetical protein